MLTVFTNFDTFSDFIKSLSGHATIFQSFYALYIKPEKQKIEHPIPTVSSVKPKPDNLKVIVFTNIGAFALEQKIDSENRDLITKKLLSLIPTLVQVKKISLKVPVVIN